MKENKLKRAFEVLLVSTKLGLTSFGGPIAHLGYYHKEYVEKRKWLDERSYADLVALCQFLPGPASSQVGIGIGSQRAGLLGGIAAWIGFTMPSAILMILFAFLLQGFDIGSSNFIHGLKIVAVVIVAHSVLSMGKKLANEKLTATIAVLAAIVALLLQTALTQVIIILASGVIGLILFKDTPLEASGINKMSSENSKVQNHYSLVFLFVFFALLVILPILRDIYPGRLIEIFDSFYRSGSLVFGGGHVVLPLLELEVVPQNWVTKSDFLAGYGAAQAIPGPLFSFSSYLGMLIAGVKGAFVALIAIFLPAFLLIIGVIPYWNRLRQNTHVKRALIGVNAAVVGILLAALYNPLWTNAIIDVKSFALAAALFAGLNYWKIPPIGIVILGAIGGMLI